MAKRSFIEKKRKILTLLFSMVLGVLILFSQSRLEEVYFLSEIFYFTGIIIVGVATVGRLWCSLYIGGHKTKELITVGPYSICRNPLYFFSFLGGIGIGFASETLTVTLLIFSAFLFYYPFVIRSEEKKLLRIHGSDFDRYMSKTPRFFPSLAGLYEPEEYTVRPRLFKRRIFDALWFVWIAGILELVEALHEYNVIPRLFRLW
ncbi:MAG: isoprenylcysteine carboxylmethyltransferase family protein [Phycisphaerae bacterium]|nr:isoprenylcysteine carboxylmethyltransferase family protein [Phycisphaerae bacterium]